MADYRKMYVLMCGAVSDSLDIMSHGLDDDSIDSVCLLLRQAMIKAENIYIQTASSDNRLEE